MNTQTDIPENIGNPAGRALKAAGITSLRQLAKLTEKELLALHGVGPKAVRILRETLEAKGMAFDAGPYGGPESGRPAMDRRRKLS